MPLPPRITIAAADVQISRVDELILGLLGGFLRGMQRLVTADKRRQASQQPDNAAAAAAEGADGRNQEALHSGTVILGAVVTMFVAMCMTALFIQ